jgi:hypothetical protein
MGERFDPFLPIPSIDHAMVLFTPPSRHICVDNRGEGGIDKGVVGYWKPYSDEVVECESGGVCDVY